MPAHLLPDGSQRCADLHLVSDEDSVYEQDVLRNPGSTKPWLAYIQFKTQHGTLRERAFVLERACLQLPRSYKLWKMHLTFRVKHVSKLNPAIFAAEYRKVNALFERGLILLNKMPRIWELYLKFLLQQPLVTTTRRTFDRALRALPITQHNRIWALYKPFANSAAGISAVKVWRRYMQIHPEDAEDFIELLTQVGLYTEAVKKYIDVLNNLRFTSKRGKGHYELWSEMVDMIVEHAAEIETGHETGIDVERIIRSGIVRFADQRGKLWCGLATYWIRRGSFERARDVFEEAVTTVMTVRDFTLVFDSYAEFEESIIGALMEVASDRADKGIVDEEADFELDIRMMRFEQLMDRRPFLLNDVVLRQNPNNVAEWEKRVALWGENQVEAVQTYTAAIATIQPKKAVGPFHQLWANYAKFYERGGDIRNARIIMEKAVKVPFKSVAELADMWIEWAEMELRNENFDDAVRIMAKAVQAPKRSTVDYFDETLSPQQRVHKSWKLWSFYVDLVESVSSLEDTRKVYERIFELRIATPQTVVNYANLLEENQYYEESFKIYERGLDLFSYPVAFELWNLYLTKAVDRKIGIERLRDLFEQAIEDCPPKFAKVIYLMYGNLEEERGLARHAMRIYERATRAVADEDRADMFNFYITKSASNFGLPSTRPIYEKAISTLPDNEARDMCLKFADMEKRLGEIDRARAIYGHASQFCDPRTSPDFWAKWEAFEVQHGNEDTFKEMLRIKRSVQAQYNTDVNFIASQALARSQRQPDVDSADPEVADAMAALERQARAPAGFVAASDTQKVGATDTTLVAANPDAIDIDDIDE
ncbi:Pre-mRNA-splicing factor SYF1 [Colletotrichum siamense]|uniref:Pre-mRNA-splicing factor SYF1 n=1 Tax=Colletotrichum siamense TaxID=690259 RepID=A0A9P5EIE9_COLSI|nr:Pre-mRNA-splicing factor SYF1 [Colletotrichum siamense]KAI8152162.1 Pre-mRNA-splicing factor SYF1 [Colletotrichum sp. SAR 10_71]KAI8155408.1 Pre-mRNA-splicing factor SYF1 [Colletotrichum sp. SAR 10_70]KAI8155967.1 Pre-mRNA-splicing factor SYF1 [Colletotrichum sp. SAR 10_65]KAI8172715.1 Pre-mRNA-splicing factor SYF1 [Colletotrichum sp. SAR 10_75]KAI8200103.1 Pre-mRNA-splicing factor SYF1 [Colletotrichum sp. SAR 10_76]KAI8214417.1 Pre-mRNA-splicing factor SYF1 [Colletotrichum sp. SAR 10_77]